MRDLADTTKPGRGGGKISKAHPLFQVEALSGWLSVAPATGPIAPSKFSLPCPPVRLGPDGSACPISAFAFSLPPSR